MRASGNLFCSSTPKKAALTGFNAPVRAFLGEGGTPPAYDFLGWGEALDFSSGRSASDSSSFSMSLRTSRLRQGGCPRSCHGGGTKTSPEQRHVDPARVGATVHGNAPLRRCAAAPTLHATFHVRPLDYRTAALFTPTLAGLDKARVYSILGGTPLSARLTGASAISKSSHRRTISRYRSARARCDRCRNSESRKWYYMVSYVRPPNTSKE